MRHNQLQLSVVDEGAQSLDHLGELFLDDLERPALDLEIAFVVGVSLVEIQQGNDGFPHDAPFDPLVPGHVLQVEMVHGRGHFRFGLGLDCQKTGDCQDQE